MGELLPVTVAAAEQPAMQVVLVCADCQHPYQPDGQAWVEGRTICPAPGCHGWTFTAELVRVPTQRTGVAR